MMYDVLAYFVLSQNVCAIRIHNNTCYVMCEAVKYIFCPNKYG